MQCRRLNPCFSGLYYLTTTWLYTIANNLSLNPCFSGLYYLTKLQEVNALEIVECLNPCFSGLYYLTLQAWYVRPY